MSRRRARALVAPTAASARVVASKGAKPRYSIRFYDHADPKVREKIGQVLAHIDAHPHRDPIWTFRALDAMPTEAEMRAAAARARSYLVPLAPPAEPCAERSDGQAHEAGRDGRCLHCDRGLDIPGPEVALKPARVIALPKRAAPIAVAPMSWVLAIGASFRELAIAAVARRWGETGTAPIAGVKFSDLPPEERARLLSERARKANETRRRMAQGAA